MGGYVNGLEHWSTAKLAVDQCSISLLQRDLRYAIRYRDIVGSCIV